MKITVEFLNEEHTKARVTIVPGWLSRLFGARPSSGLADRHVANVWQWSTTHRNIRDDRYARRLMRALELQEVEELPRARLVEGARIENCTAGGDIVAINHGRKRT